MYFVTQMPIAGFEQAAKPGEWTVRISARGTVLHERKFTIKGDPAAARALSVRRITRIPNDNGTTGLQLEGTGLNSESVTHLATYSPSSAWQFLASLSIQQLARPASSPPTMQHSLLANTGSSS